LEKPKHLLVNRLPLYEGEKFVTLQNGGKVFYPSYVFNQSNFIDSFKEIGYELIDIWEDWNDSCIIPFHPEKSLLFYRGLYFKLRS
jgi:putative methyltransferase (TIGR04325 family)